MTCLLCQTVLSSELTLPKIFSFQKLNNSKVCRKCFNRFVKLSDMKTCRYCGRRIFGNLNDPCQDCIKWQHYFKKPFANRALFEYNDAMRAYMKQYKFLGDYRLRNVFNRLIVSELKAMRCPIVVIPVNESTFQERGFNQVLELCEGVQPVNCLRTRQGKKESRQSEKNRSQRLNADQPFELIDHESELIRKKTIVVVDDVYTTGTTIRHAAALLYRAGARCVKGFTLAR